MLPSGKTLRLRCFGSRWWGTARTTVDRLVLWELRQTVRSLVFQVELAEKRVRLLTPTRQPQIRRRRPAPPVTLWLLEAIARFLWTMSHENSLNYLLLAGDMYSESTDTEDISVTSDALLFWSSDYSTNHMGWLCRIMSAVCDSHVSTVTSASFHLWRTRWSTFVQVPLASVEPSKFLVRGFVQLYGGTHQWNLVGMPRRGRT